MSPARRSGHERFRERSGGLTRLRQKIKILEKGRARSCEQWHPPRLPVSQHLLSNTKRWHPPRLPVSQRLLSKHQTMAPTPPARPPTPPLQHQTMAPTPTAHPQRLLSNTKRWHPPRLPIPNVSSPTPNDGTHPDCPSPIVSSPNTTGQGEGENKTTRAFLEVQGLRLHTPNAGGPVQSPAKD